MPKKRPQLFIIAGCNGAGKTTASRVLFPDIYQIKEFVNADAIASGLSPFNPEAVAFQAGRLMLQRIDELMREGTTFAFETTLSARSYVDLIHRAKACGYKVVLIFLWLKDARTAQQRVESRVSKGGHNIPKDVIIRRYARGLVNLFAIYMEETDRWMLVDSTRKRLDVIAFGRRNSQVVMNDRKWMKVLKTAKRN